MINRKSVRPEVATTALAYVSTMHCKWGADFERSKSNVDVEFRYIYIMSEVQCCKMWDLHRQCRNRFERQAQVTLAFAAAAAAGSVGDWYDDAGDGISALLRH